jgi:Zn-dependent M28 family amino/carboxypeptidase
MRARSVVAAPLVLLAALAATPVSAQQPAPQIESIRADQLRADLFFLAGDAFRGRLTNTPENQLAAEWIKSRFQRLGLKPAAADTTFIHRYNLVTAALGTGNAMTVSAPNGMTMTPQVGRDFYPQRFSANGKVAGPLVFAGFGMAAPSLDYDDYRAPQVKGAVVLALAHEPGETDPASTFEGLITMQAAGALEKTLAAQERGAAAILFVSDVHNHPGEVNFEGEAQNFWPATAPRIERYTLAQWAERVTIPALTISPALADQLLRRTGKTLAELSAASESRRGSAPILVPDTRVEVTAGVLRHVVPDRNVVALIEGSDPVLKDEWIIISAHFDHDGADAVGVFNGADDDGSGIVSLLEIAEAYALAAESGQRPRRSILLAAWNSEERGLLGAWAYAERPLHPLPQTIAVLNMDMVGRNEEVPVGGGNRFRGLEVQTAESNSNAVNIMGYSRSPALYAAVQRANSGIGLELKARYDNNVSQLLRRSDQWPFIQKGVAAVFFHTGLHPDYHTQFDRPEKINYAKMEKIARLVFQTSWDLAQGGRPVTEQATR